MIVVPPPARAVYIAIPKTGSASMTAFLSGRYGARRIGKGHDSIVPTEYIGWTVFTMVRNPYERLASHWWFETRQRTNPPALGPIDFEDWYWRCQVWRKCGHSHSSPADMYKDQVSFVRDSKATIVLKLEEMPEGIADLPFADAAPARFPHVRAPRPAEAVLGESDRRMIAEDYAEDFSAFGYDQ